MGGSHRQPELRSMDTVRGPLPVAVPALHGDRLDVSRRLRSRGLLRTASWQPIKNQFRESADTAAASSLARVKPATRPNRPVHHGVFHWKLDPESWLFVLRSVV